MNVNNFSFTVGAQIHHLLSGLSKKNFKSSVAEIEHLGTLYGRETYLHVLGILLKELFGRGKGGGKDVHKTLLQQQMMRLSDEPHFASTLVRIIEGIELNDEFLSQLSDVLRLRFAQELVLGLSVARSSKFETHSEGIRFLREKLTEDITPHLESMPKPLIQKLVLFLKSADGLSKERSSVYRAIEAYALEHQSPLLHSYLSNDGSDMPMWTLSGAKEGIDRVCALRDSLGAGCHISEMMEDIGYSCCQSRANIEDIIGQFGGVSEADVARIIAMMTRTRIGLEDLGLSLSSSSTGKGKQEATTTWKIDIFADTINRMYPGFAWPSVIHALCDLPEFHLSDQKEFMMLMSFYAMATDEPFPVGAALDKLWPNSRGQLSFLRYAVGAPPDVICLGTNADHGHGDHSSSSGGAHHWSSPKLVHRLLQLAEVEDYDAVVHLLRSPLEQCPAVLLRSLMSVEPTWGSLHAELSSAVVSMFLANSSLPGAMDALHGVWREHQRLVIRCMAELYFKDRSILSRLLDVAQELKALASILGAQSFLFTIALAALSGRREHLNLSKWLQERIAQHKLPFIKGCLAFLHQHRGPDGKYHGAGLSDAIVAIFERCLRARLDAMPPDVAEEVLALGNGPHAGGAPARINAGGVGGAPGVGGSVLGEDTAFPKEIEDTTNAIFQSLYGGQVTVEEVVALLKKLKTSPTSEDKREQRIFACMIHNLFDEYRFFPKYPHKYLRVTAVLFGSLIQHQLISYIPLGLALRYVLEALKQAPSSKMFKFGVTALDQFKYRLAEWPQYCAHIMQIPHMQQYHPGIVEHIEAIYAGKGAGVGPVDPKGEDGRLPPWRLEAGGAPEEGAPPNTTASTTSATATAGGGFSPGTSTTAGGAGNGEEAMMSLDSLLMSGMPAPLEVDEKTRDSIFFVCNNLALGNLDKKVNELLAFLKVEHHPYLAHYIVIKRITTEPTYHDVYVGLLEALERKGHSGLLRLVLRGTYEAIGVLLRSENAMSRSQDRSALKNLGSWLGKLTLARNKPVLHNDLPLKYVVLDAYDQGRLMAVVPFAAKVLESASGSRVFAPPNVWTGALLRLLCEIYHLPDLKLNLKFEIELLCKNLGVALGELTPSTLLKNRKPRQRLRGAPPGGPVASGGGNKPSGGGGPANAQGPFIATLWTKCQVPNTPLFKQQAGLQRCIPVAIDRAIKEIISPVAERSATIASITTRELVLKDMAREGNESVVQRVAATMVRSLAGSLALVTCRDTLRTSIVTHLRGLLSAAVEAGGGAAGGGSGGEATGLVEHAVQTVTAENLDLACALIERHTVDLAVKETDNLLAPEYEARRKHRETHGDAPYADAKFLHGRYPSYLPDALRPSPEGVQGHQHHVYESFADVSALSVPPGGAGDGASPAASSANAGGAAPAVAQSHTDAEALAHSLDKLKQFVKELDSTIAHSGPAGNGNAELQRKLLQLPRVIAQYVVSEEVAFAFAKTLFMSLYERKDLREYNVSVYIAILARIRDVVPAVQHHLTSWIKYTEIEHKYNHNITVALVSAQLINVSEFDAYLCHRIDGGRNSGALEFALYLVKRCVLDERALSPADLGRTLGAVHHIAASTRAGASSSSSGDVVGDGPSTTSSSSGGGVGDNAPPPPPPEMVGVAREVLARVVAQGYDPARAPLGPAGPGKGVELPSMDGETHVTQVQEMLSEWTRMHSSNPSEAAATAFLSALRDRLAPPKDATDGSSPTEGSGDGPLTIHRVFVVGSRLAYREVLSRRNASAASGGGEEAMPFGPVDHLAKLGVGLFALALSEASDSKGEGVALRVAQMVVQGSSQGMVSEHDATASAIMSPASDAAPFNQRPFYRLISTMVAGILSAAEDTAQHEALVGAILCAHASALATIGPVRAPGFAFAWLSLVGHRAFMPKLLLLPSNRGWAPFHHLVLQQLRFLEPFLRQAELGDPVRRLYQGTLRVLLVLLHDFPEFLSDYHFSFCDAIPSSCIQMRNLVLSAFPRTMRLPDPFTPNLKVDLLPEINQSPHILSEYTRGISAFKEDVDAYLKRGGPAAFLVELRKKLTLSPSDAIKRGTRYDVPMLNSLVLYVGTQAIAQLQAASKTATISQSAPMEIFQHLMVDLDSEGRYLFLNSIANQLRYPNNHTHYFSCVLLYLFAEANQANQKNIQEQITRVLLERLIVHRPHPWGLLITFIELIKNPRYSFWSHSFTRCSPEIERIFESVARIAIKG